MLLFKGDLAVGVLIPVGVVVSLLSAHLMFKKGWVRIMTDRIPCQLISRSPNLTFIGMVVYNHHTITRDGGYK